MAGNKALRIIIIDDDPAINLLLKTALVQRGHHVSTFSDPAACLALKKTTHSCLQGSSCADVIISDVVMPGISGIDFFKLQTARGCKTPEGNKAFISATTRQEHFDAIAELGYKFFNKPFKLLEIVKWVESCADRVSDTG
jgi:DNA-binding NtrC family response regulator